MPKSVATFAGLGCRIWKSRIMATKKILLRIRTLAFLTQNGIVHTTRGFPPSSLVRRLQSKDPFEDTVSSFDQKTQVGQSQRSLRPRSSLQSLSSLSWRGCCVETRKVKRITDLSSSVTQSAKEVLSTENACACTASSWSHDDHFLSRLFFPARWFQQAWWIHQQVDPCALPRKYRLPPWMSGMPTKRIKEFTFLSTVGVLGRHALVGKMWRFGKNQSTKSRTGVPCPYMEGEVWNQLKLF